MSEENENMNVLTGMFPEFDKEVLVLLLERNQNNLERTIDCVLNMSESNRVPEPAVASETGVVLPSPEEERNELGLTDTELAFMLQNDTLFQEELKLYFHDYKSDNASDLRATAQRGANSNLNRDSPTNDILDIPNLGILKGLSDTSSEMKKRFTAFAAQYLEKKNTLSSGSSAAAPVEASTTRTAAATSNPLLNQSTASAKSSFTIDDEEEEILFINPNGKRVDSRSQSNPNSFGESALNSLNSIWNNLPSISKTGRSSSRAESSDLHS